MVNYVMVDEDDEFNPMVQGSLKERGFDVVDLGNGTFDLYVDLGKGEGFFIELKTADKNYKAWAKKKGINLSNQSSAIWNQMNDESYPIVIACDNDDIETCYLILPEKLRKLAKHRMEERDEDNILIGVVKDDGTPRIEKMEYEECIDELASFLKSFNQ